MLTKIEKCDQIRRKCLLPIGILALLLSNLVIFACDPIHRSAFRVAIPISDHLTESGVQSMAEALFAVNEIAMRNGMKEMPYNLPLEPESTGRIYSIQISPRTGVTLTVVAYIKKREIEILLADVFKFSQSNVSKRIQDDLIITIKEKYGENSIRRN